MSRNRTDSAVGFTSSCGVVLVQTAMNTELENDSILEHVQAKIKL